MAAPPGGSGTALRIGIDARELVRGRRTGIGRVLRDFLVHARTHRPAHRFYLYGNQHTDTGLAGGNIDLTIVPEGSTVWWDQVVLSRLARRDGLDVLLSPYMKGPVRAPCPLVVTIHDLIDFVFPAYRRPRNLLVKWMASWVGRHADLVLTGSAHARRDIEAVLGIDGGRIHVVPLGVDPGFQPVADAERLRAVRDRYGIEAPYLLYLGNFKPHKNVAALLRAYAQLAAPLRARTHLVLGGHEDRWRGAHQRLAGDLGIAPRTRFIGAVDDADMAPLYSGAELFVFPSLYEGFGLPPLEAMACGTAVVVSNRSSLPEVVGEAGCLFDPGDPAALTAALARLLADGAARERLAAAGLARARGFRLEDACEGQLRALEEVAAGRRPA